MHLFLHVRENIVISTGGGSGTGADAQENARTGAGQTRIDVWKP